MSGTVIDLTRYEKSIKTLLANAITQYYREHPKVVVSLLVLEYSGMNPVLLVSLDTQKHSDDLQKKWPGSCEVDEHGEFNPNPSDCEFQLTHYRFAGFPDLCIAELPLVFKSAAGTVTLESLGNEKLNKVMFDFLVPIMKSFVGYRMLKREPIFRMGVYVQDSRYSEFWRVAE